VRSVPTAQLAAYRYPVTQRAKAVRAVEHRLGSAFVVHAVGHFLIASSCGESEKERIALGNALDAFYEQLTLHYQLAADPQFVTLVLVPNSRSLARQALQLHGIALPELDLPQDAEPSDPTLIYKSQADLTIVCVRTESVVTDDRYPLPPPLYIVGSSIPESQMAGYLAELSLDHDFGYMPAWLHVGVLAPYNNAHLFKDRLDTPIGRDTLAASAFTQPGPFSPLMPYFSDEDLRDRPSLRFLIRADWRAFDDAEPDWIGTLRLRRISTLFVRYLEDIGKLPKVYVALRDRPLSDTVNPAFRDEKLIETALGRSLSSLEVDFDRWLRSQSKLTGENFSSFPAGQGGF
jgi:hypothetical protein